MPRRLLAVGIGLVCLAGAAALLLAIPALFQPWARAYDSHLLTLTISFAIVSLWPQRLPSGSTFLPGVALSVAGLFLLPPILTVLVPVPGLICHTVAMRRHWWHYLQTIGHGAISLYLGALTYVWLAPEGPLTLPASLPGALAALAVNEVVQRLISIVIVAYRLRRGLLDQAHRHLLDRNWGSFGLTLMGLTAALAYQNDGIWGLLLHAVLVVSLAQCVSYFTQAGALRQAAWTDGLTGAGNRTAWEDFVRAVRHRPDLAEGTLIVIDLDGFKAVNDRHGHTVGDRLLKEMAATMEKRLRQTDRLFRYGGDEFVVFVNHGPKAHGFVRERVTRTVEEVTQEWNREGYAVTASLGMVTIPTEAADLPGAFRLADERMYRQKGRHVR